VATLDAVALAAVAGPPLLRPFWRGANSVMVQCFPPGFAFQRCPGNFMHGAPANYVGGKSDHAVRERSSAGTSPKGLAADAVTRAKLAHRKWCRHCFASQIAGAETETQAWL